MPEKKQIVPPFNKEDIVEITKDAILTGQIASEPKPLDENETYTVKVVKGKIVLVLDEPI